MTLGPFYPSASEAALTGVAYATQEAYRTLRGTLTYSYVTLVYDDGRKVPMTSGGLVLSAANIQTFADRALYICNVPAYLETSDFETRSPGKVAETGFLFGRKAPNRRFA